MKNVLLFNIKRLVILFLLIMMFVLVGCQDEVVSTLTINYETNGGNEIASMTLYPEQVSSYVLPQNPVREGYDFAGWYIDSEYSVAFTGLDSEVTTITLYAKWTEKVVEEENPVPTEEDLIGTWYANGTILIFKEKKSAEITISQGTYNATYSIASTGKITVVTSISGVPLVLSGYLVDEVITFKLFGEELEFIKLGDDDIVRIKYPNLSRLNGVDFTSNISSKIEINIDLNDEKLRSLLKDLRINLFKDQNKGDVNDSNQEGENQNIDLETDEEKIFNTTIELSYEVNGILGNVTVEDIKDLEAYLDFNGGFIFNTNSEDFNESEYEAFKLAFSEFKVYIKDGIAYTQINLPIKENVDEEITFKNQETYGYIDLNELFNIIKTETNGEVDVKAIIERLPFEMIASFIFGESSSTFDIKSMLSMASMFGITSDIANSVNEIIDDFTPNVLEEGNKKTYSLANENVNNGISGILELLRNNKTILDLLMSNNNLGNMSDEDYGKLINGLEELHSFISDNVTIEDLKLETIEENGKIKNANSDIKINIKFDEESNFYINVVSNSELSVNRYDATIDYPDFSSYENIAGIIRDYK